MQMGKEYAEAPPCSMEDLYNDSENTTPVIFVLKQGADPSMNVIAFAENNYKNKIDFLSLGQGQGKNAEALIERGMSEGRFVLLQNCHLYKSWMPKLEQIVLDFTESQQEIHEDFRLSLTSMPVEYFPVSVLQNGLKLTTEPPKGLKANLKLSYHEMTEETFSIKEKEIEWRQLLYGLCFFHAVLQER